LFAEHVVFYCPIDFYFIVKKYFDVIKPKKFIIAETELWFELLFQAKKIPCYLANARLTERSFKSYSLPVLKNITQIALDSFDMIFAQSKSDATRFAQLGISLEKIKILGNLKFDNLPKTLQAPSPRINNNEIVFIAGSSHQKDEEIILEAFNQVKLKNSAKSLQLIIAPRHLERIEQTEKFCQKYNLKYFRKSNIECPLSGDGESLGEKDVLILDTMGELSSFYRMADLAFLGGTWAKVGGHNPLEPLASGIPVLVGEHTFKISDLTDDLINRKLVFRTETVEEIVKYLENFIQKHPSIKKNQLEEINVAKNTVKYI